MTSALVILKILLSMHGYVPRKCHEWRISNRNVSLKSNGWKKAIGLLNEHFRIFRTSRKFRVVIARSHLLPIQ